MRSFFLIDKNEVSNRILFVGGIEERKGLHVLIDAIAIVKKVIPDIKLHIVGGVRKASYYRSLSTQIVNLDLQESIIFRGHLSDSELMQEYSESTVLVLPSKEESLGVVLLEAYGNRNTSCCVKCRWDSGYRRGWSKRISGKLW